MAMFMDEPGALRVQTLLGDALAGKHEVFMTVVNLGEVLYNIESRRGSDAARGALAGIDQSGIQIIDVDRSLALSAARLKAATGIGYADSFVAALAQQVSASVITGDSDFHAVEHLVPVEWLNVS